MRLIVQQCSNKQSCSSHVFTYVKGRYTNAMLNSIEWQSYFLRFFTALQIKCPHEYKQTKDKKTIIVKHLYLKLSSRPLNTPIYLLNKETEKAGNFSA